MVCSIKGERWYLWRAVDDEGEVLDLVMQRERNTEAALKILKRLLGTDRLKPQSPQWRFLGAKAFALAKQLSLIFLGNFSGV